MITNQKTKIAIFAFLAIAALSIGLGPIVSYASHTAVTADASITAATGYVISLSAVTTCGTSSCIAQVSGDTVWGTLGVTYGNGGNTCEVISHTTVNSDLVYTYTGSITGTITDNTGYVLSAGDFLEVTNTYSDCT